MRAYVAIASLFVCLVSGGGLAASPATLSPTLADHQISTGGATHMALGFDPASGNLFAVLQEGADWSLYISTDRGVTWLQTFLFDGTFLTGLEVDLAVHAGYVYVASSIGGNLGGFSTAAIRRFSTATGVQDEAWGDNSVASHNDRSIEEISLVITPTGSILVTLLYDLDYIMVRVGAVTNGASWVNHNPGLNDAERGLDTACPGAGSSILLCLSYVGTDGRIYFIRLSGAWAYSPVDAITSDDGVDKTSIAAQGDHVVIAWSFKDPTSPYQGVESIHGTNLVYESLDWEMWPKWESASTAYHDPLVAFGSGESSAMLHEMAGAIMVRQHSSCDADWPTDHLTVNDHPFVLGDGDRFAFESVGGGYGVVYPSSVGGVYFASTLLFADGFEGGNTGAWSSAEP